jgi:hypothetical protein
MKRIPKFIWFLILAGFLGCSKSGSIDEMVKMEGTRTPHPNIESDLTGQFVDAAHPTRGMAYINKAHTKLSLTNFKTYDGPLLEIDLATD